jgi:tetratricopeptide (TPR) repeat protein
MAAKKSGESDLDRAEAWNRLGLEAYAEWDVEEAVKQFRAAIDVASDRSEYHLNLARALSRAGDFDQALRALAEFLRLEPDSEAAERFERLFASGMDEVESVLTEKMAAAGIPIEEIGAAMQMWMEYRISIGRDSLPLRKPEAWAAALDYAVRKVNLRQVSQKKVADLYGVSVRTVRERFGDLVAALDVMPCDYRYFVGDQNPLDKLVEAAELLEQLETSFHRP